MIYTFQDQMQPTQDVDFLRTVFNKSKTVLPISLETEHAYAHK